MDEQYLYLETMKKTLILLIGTNPLPNYLVAKYLLDKEEIDKIFLLHSANNPNINQLSTENYANQLSALLNNSAIAIAKIALKNISSAIEIYSDLDDAITTMPENIHLNFTGGTKAMAVHIYNYFATNHFVKSIAFSYLDARNDALITHSISNNNFNESKTSNISNQLSMNLNELVQLHDYKIESKYTDKENADFKDFDNYINDVNDISLLKDFSKELNKIKGFEKSIRNFQELTNFVNNNKYSAVLKVSKFKQIINNTKIPNNIFNNPTIDTINFQNYLNTLNYFINDKYLEHLVFLTLKDAISQYNTTQNATSITNYGSSIEIRKDANNASIKKFEIDGFFVKGHNLFGISCTTAFKRNTVKAKGFEIIHRTKQIGGEEARAIVVALPDGQDLKKQELINKNEQINTGLVEELAEITGTSQERFFVLRYYDKQTLIKQFLEILNI